MLFPRTESSLCFFVRKAGDDGAMCKTSLVVTMVRSSAMNTVPIPFLSSLTLRDLPEFVLVGGLRVRLGPPPLYRYWHRHCCFRLHCRRCCCCHCRYYHRCYRCCQRRQAPLRSPPLGVGSVLSRRVSLLLPLLLRLQMHLMLQLWMPVAAVSTPPANQTSEGHREV